MNSLDRSNWQKNRMEYPFLSPSAQTPATTIPTLTNKVMDSLDSISQYQHQLQHSEQQLQQQRISDETISIPAVKQQPLQKKQLKNNKISVVGLGGVSSGGGGGEINVVSIDEIPSSIATTTATSTTASIVLIGDTSGGSGGDRNDLGSWQPRDSQQDINELTELDSNLIETGPTKRNESMILFM